MADVFVLVKGNQTGFHRFCRVFSLQGLNAGFLVRADQISSLLIQFNGLLIQFAHDAYLFGEGLWVLLSFIVQPVMAALGLQFGFALKNAPLDGLKYS